LKYIVISPYSRKIAETNEKSPKDYPYWEKLIELIKEKEIKIIQAIGYDDEPIIKGVDESVKYKLDELKTFLLNDDCLCFISVDNFMGHFGKFIGKRGIVLWGTSDPNIFGYEENINLLKSRDNLRKFQFAKWCIEEYREDVFVNPEIVIKALEENFF